MKSEWTNLIVKCSGLSCVRGGRRVYDQLAFSVSSGELLVLRGGNGSGKSTLLRQMAGFLPIYEGSASVDIDNEQHELIDNIHYSGHLSGVKPYLTVIENLEFWQHLFGGDVDISSALKFWGLTQLANTPARLLSEGQKRRVGLARLLLSSRAIWLLDEPNVGLDVENLERLESAVQKHLKQGGVVIMASHVSVNSSNMVELDMAEFKIKERVA